MSDETYSPKRMDEADARADAHTRAVLDTARAKPQSPSISDVVNAFDALGGFEVLDAVLANTLVKRGFGLTEVKAVITEAIGAGALERVVNGGIIKPVQG